MKEANITKKEILKFLQNLREEDKMEFDEYLKTNTLDDFFDSCFDKAGITYYVVTDNNKPLALGGAYLEKENVARIWLLVTNEVIKNKISLFKYIKYKINEFKNNFDFLYNFIFKSNFSSLSWLERLGFSSIDLEIDDYKMFYFKKGDCNFDLRYIAC